MKEPSVLAGIHAVLAALEAPGRRIDRVFLLEGRRGGRIHEVREAARRAGVPFVEVSAERIERLAAGARHQGVVALAAAATYASTASLIELCAGGGRLVLLDGVEDPRNLGAVIRSAAAAGARGVFIPEHRSAGLGPAAARTAAGSLERIGVARCRNIADLAADLREQGFWVAGLDPRGDVSWDEAAYRRRMAVVVGGEARGLRPRVRRACDVTVSIPLAPGVESLNLSVAAALVLYEGIRRDRASAGRK